MPRYALLIEYDGAPYCGWQRQVDLPSVQGALEAALAAIAPEAPLVQAAGRTDTGVHATGQVVHVDLAKSWDAFKLAGALNAHLRPAPVAVLKAVAIGDEFRARFSALERRYLYRILLRKAPAILTQGRVWRIGYKLDAAAMQAGAQHLIGHHDYTTFRATECQAKSPVKSIDEITVHENESAFGRELHIEVRARSFLHNQVRSIVGSLERVGAGAWQPEDVAAALEAKDRAACGPVAPAMGLYLTHVRYERDPFA